MTYLRWMLALLVQCLATLMGDGSSQMVRKRPRCFAEWRNWLRPMGCGQVLHSRGCLCGRRGPRLVLAVKSASSWQWMSMRYDTSLVSCYMHWALYLNCCAPCGAGAPLFPPCLFTSLSFPLLLFPFFHWLYLFSSFVHPFPFYQNSPTPFPGRRL